MRGAVPRVEHQAPGRRHPGEPHLRRPLRRATARRPRARTRRATPGPACCEAMPATDPAGTAPTVLNDTTTAGYDPTHDAACETDRDRRRQDGHVRDRRRRGRKPVRQPAERRRRSTRRPVQPLWDLASAGALADRYFQPVVGQSYANDMYLARAQFVFADDTVRPAGSGGRRRCGVEAQAGAAHGHDHRRSAHGARRPLGVLRGGLRRDAGRPTGAARPSPPTARSPCRSIRAASSRATSRSSTTRRRGTTRRR